MKGSGVPWVGMSEQSPKKRENSQPSSLSGVACSITTGKPLKRAQRTSSASFLPVWGGGREVSSEQQGKESEGGGEGWASVRARVTMWSAWGHGQLRRCVYCLTFLADKGILVEVEEHMRHATAARLQRRRDGTGERREFIRMRSGCREFRADAEPHLAPPLIVADRPQIAQPGEELTNPAQPNATSAVPAVAGARRRHCRHLPGRLGRERVAGCASRALLRRATCDTISTAAVADTFILCTGVGAAAADAGAAIAGAAATSAAASDEVLRTSPASETMPSPSQLPSRDSSGTLPPPPPPSVLRHEERSRLLRNVGSAVPVSVRRRVGSCSWRKPSCNISSAAAAPGLYRLA
eukprot:scaffold17596_cov82-Phaeocystis_antarctica.AAC.2